MAAVQVESPSQLGNVEYQPLANFGNVNYGANANLRENALLLSQNYQIGEAQKYSANGQGVVTITKHTDTLTEVAYKHETEVGPDRKRRIKTTSCRVLYSSDNEVIDQFYGDTVAITLADGVLGIHADKEKKAAGGRSGMLRRDRRHLR